MTCTGSWDAAQVAGEDVVPTGLTFTVTYDGGTTADVTNSVTVSPEQWADEAGTQTATFSYSENGETITCTKDATVIARVAAPAIACESNSVTMSSATDGASIYYTTDGTTPTSESTAYSAAITIEADTTFKAIAVKSGMADSEVTTETCEYEAPQEP